MKMGAITGAILCTVAAGGHAQAEQKFERLTGVQIQAKFAGIELTDEAHWGEVFERNGTLTTTTMGHRSVGKWRVQKDLLCIDHGNAPGGGYDVWLSEKRGAQKPDLEFAFGRRAAEAHGPPLTANSVRHAHGHKRRPMTHKLRTLETST